MCYQDTDVCGVNLETKKVVNCSDAPGQCDEPEGIYPDGQYTLVERDKQNHRGSSHVDLWKLKLERLRQRMTDWLITLDIEPRWVLPEPVANVPPRPPSRRPNRQPAS